MKPGRELDALIAEKVMGTGPHHIRDGLRAYHKYSTDIAAAWEVVEKIKDKGFSFTCISGIASGYDVVAFESPIKGRACVDRSCGSTSVPHGICLAALKALGHEVE